MSYCGIEQFAVNVSRNWCFGRRRRGSGNVRRAASTAVIGAIIALGVGTVALAHHAVHAQFDVSKNVYLKGVLTKVEWINPHSYIYMDVKDKKGKSTAWSFETGAPNALRRAGLSKRELLKVGDTLEIRANPARNGKNLGLANELILPDGKIVRVGSTQSLSDQYD